MKRLVFSIALAAFLLLPLNLQAQVFDLATVAPAPPVEVMPGTPPNVTLINRIPGVEYTVISVVRTRVMPPIPLPEDFPKGQMFLAGFLVCNEVPLNTWLDTLRKADSEAAVASAVSSTSVAALRQVYSDACWDSLAQEKVARAIHSTRLEVDLSGYRLVENQQLLMTATRIAGAEVRTWSFTLQTAEAGNWLTTWGFGFTKDRSDRYFQKQLADGTFQIAKERELENTDLAFVPSVFFHWMPRNDETLDWSFSPLTAGIGLREDGPSVMLGVSVTRRQNISLIAGLASSRAHRLGGVYEPDQILKEKVADEALFENTYRPSFFVSLAIRFDKNPFGERGAGAAAKGEQESEAGKEKKATDEAAKKKGA